MQSIVITGNTPLSGTIAISGAKNAALPLMSASLLTEDTLTLHNVPRLADVRTMEQLLAQHGASTQWVQSSDGSATYHLQAAAIVDTTAPYDLVRTMRASVLVLGPLLARCGEARVSLPGGCAIGTRPIDQHLQGLQQMGADILLEEGYVHARVHGRLQGAHITFDKVSVTGTENLMMAACLAQGTTVLSNAAREPEVEDLAQCLQAMGAQIEGGGTDRIEIQGQAQLHGAQHHVMPDRIEAGSYAIAAAITGGDLLLQNMRLEHLEAVVEKLEEVGVSLAAEDGGGVRVCRASGGLRAVDITTQPYPGFPTDMQAQMMALLSVAEGASVITETIFENRFMHVPELVRMGANIAVQGRSAMVRGVDHLVGAHVMATDLRASMSLVLAALAARGTTVIHRVYHLDRGYGVLVRKLAACGAQIAREQDVPVPPSSGMEAMSAAQEKEAHRDDT